MKFPAPLVKGKLIKRYKRFLADVELDSGEIVTSHCANPGSMMGLKDPGNSVWLSPAQNPDRKLKWDWQLVETKIHGRKATVGINTNHPNCIVLDAIRAGQIAELDGYASQRPEVKYGKNSRIDILLEDDGKPTCYVEVKNVTLLRDKGVVEFPDSVTNRGAKHLGELADMVADGHRAVMFYLVQRDDAESLKLAQDLDPAYTEAFRDAHRRGVEALVYCCKLGVEEITIDRRLTLIAPNDGN